jgi:hypothetical protein
MSRIPPVDRNTPDDGIRRNFDVIQKQLGVVPNMMHTITQSLSVLEGYLALDNQSPSGVSDARSSDPPAGWTSGLSWGSIGAITVSDSLL